MSELFSGEILALMFGTEGLLATLYMTVVSTLLAYVIGLPLGLILVVTADDGIRPVRALNRVLGAVINILRSVPFLLLIVVLIPLTRAIAGSIIGPTAMIVSLVAAAAPYIARMVESSAKEVDRGVVEASISMGASPWQVVWKVIVPEALPSLLTGATIVTTTVLGYSAMAGILGAGGLGRHCHQLWILPQPAGSHVVCPDHHHPGGAADPGTGQLDCPKVRQADPLTACRPMSLRQGTYRVFLEKERN